MTALVTWLLIGVVCVLPVLAVHALWVECRQPRPRPAVTQLRRRQLDRIEEATS